MCIDYVVCPVCGCGDMKKETLDEEGNVLIYCVNHVCASNGGTNSRALTLELEAQVAVADVRLKRFEEKIIEWGCFDEECDYGWVCEDCPIVYLVEQAKAKEGE